MAKEQKSMIGSGMAVGAGVAAVVATVAGAYFLYGSKDAKKHRKMVRSWSLKAKGEILEQLENLSEVNEEVYHKIVKEVTDKYQSLKNVDKADVMAFVDELKKHWKGIEKEVKAFHKKSKSKK